MRNITLLCAIGAISLTLSACGGGEDSASTGGGAGGATSASGSGSGSSSSSSGGGSSSSSSGVGGNSPGADQIIINEINAVGTSEWVEIANKSDKAVDIGGYAVADSVKMVGGPNLKSALRFPVGASIDAGGYVIVLGNQTAEMPPVNHPGCLPNAASSATCYFAEWKISNMSGEFVYFLSRNDEMIASAEYPANALDPLAAGQSWSRLPDKTGDFAVAPAATPGSENKP